MPNTLHFCGRQPEIDQIVERWRIASNVVDPNPQIVVLKAERGLGKTRLGMEFYRWLSDHADGWLGKGYWPDALQVIDRNLPVNPEPFDCDYKVPIPYLWWGLRCADPGAENGVAGDAISAYDRFLTPHLVSLTVKARMKERVWSVAKAWGDVGIDLAANALHYDTILSVGKGLLTTGQILLGTVDDQARSKAALHSISRSDAVLKEMEQAFKPGTLTYAAVPGVIFLDDAQFADHDPALPTFLDKLVHKVITEKWPVLLLVTHWKAELSLDLSSNTNSFSAVLQHARTGLPSHLRPITKVPGGFLSEDHFAEIDLAPIGDLAPALKAELKGLTEVQLETILSEIGGNPRLLEQVVAFLREHENYFESFDTDAPLTTAGIDETLKEVRTQDIFKIVMRRLRRAPEEVQEAICLASLQGIRFVGGLVESLAEATVRRSAKQGLRKAEDPYSILLGTGQDDKPIGEFAERLFLQVATERRQSPKSLGGEEALQISFRDTVKSLLADSAYRRNAPADALAIAYTVAARLFESSPVPSERLVAQKALNDLGAVEVLRNSLEATVSRA